MSRIIGRVLFMNADGGVQFTALYDLPHALRDPEVFTEHGVFHQNHQTPEGQWVYKFMRPRGDRPADTDLKDYRHPTDANWDGPKPARPTATLAMVDQRLLQLMRNGCGPQELQELRTLIDAAFHRLPVPDLTAVEAQVVSGVVISSGPPAWKRRDDTWHDFDGGIREPLKSTEPPVS